MVFEFKDKPVVVKSEATPDERLEASFNREVLERAYFAPDAPKEDLFIASLERSYLAPAANKEDMLVTALSTGIGLEQETLQYLKPNADLNRQIAELEKSPEWQATTVARIIKEIDDGGDFS